MSQEGVQGAEGQVWVIVHPDQLFQPVGIFDNEPEALAALEEAQKFAESSASIPLAGPVIEKTYVPHYRAMRVERWRVQR